jgi:hypothetical protein
MLTILMWIPRLYLWRWLPGGKRARFYLINVMRARHPAWFREDLERLFGLLATRASGRASPSGYPSMRSPRHTAVLRRAVSRASSSCARTSRRDATGCRLSASRAPLPSRQRPRPERRASARSLPCRRPIRCLRWLVGDRASILGLGEPEPAQLVLTTGIGQALKGRN